MAIFQDAGVRKRERKHRETGHNNDLISSKRRITIKKQQMIQHDSCPNRKITTTQHTTVSV